MIVFLPILGLVWSERFMKCAIGKGVDRESKYFYLLIRDLGLSIQNILIQN
jgi:hypothetical protein